jgi:sialate O-acetylesterase
MPIGKFTIPTPKEGGPFSIPSKGYNEVVLKNILIGEVWLCSGQSNMEMSVNWELKMAMKKQRHQLNIRFFYSFKTDGY